jgi:hypothetical protein
MLNHEAILTLLAAGKITLSDASRALAKPNKARGVPRAELREKAALRRAEEAKQPPIWRLAESTVKARPVTPIVADRQIVAGVASGVVSVPVAAALLCG